MKKLIFIISIIVMFSCENTEVVNDSRTDSIINNLIDINHRIVKDWNHDVDSIIVENNKLHKKVDSILKQKIPRYRYSSKCEPPTILYEPLFDPYFTYEGSILSFDSIACVSGSISIVPWGRTYTQPNIQYLDSINKTVLITPL